LWVGIATGAGKPAVFPKRVPRVRVGLPNLDTAHNRVPIPRYRGYKRVFQPTVFSQQNQIIHTIIHKFSSKYCQVVVFPFCPGKDMCHLVSHRDTTEYGLQAARTSLLSTKSLAHSGTSHPIFRNKVSDCFIYSN